MADIVTLISGFGLGAIAQSVIQYWLSGRRYVRERDFAQKRDAYVGFLEALNKSESFPSREAALEVGHWISRCELVASELVISELEQVLVTNPTDGDPHPDRPRVLRSLKLAMRADLKRI